MINTKKSSLRESTCAHETENGLGRTLQAGWWRTTEKSLCKDCGKAFQRGKQKQRPQRKKNNKSPVTLIREWKGGWYSLSANLFAFQCVIYELWTRTEGTKVSTIWKDTQNGGKIISSTLFPQSGKS